MEVIFNEIIGYKDKSKKSSIDNKGSKDLKYTTN